MDDNQSMNDNQDVPALNDGVGGEQVSRDPQFSSAVTTQLQHQINSLPPEANELDLIEKEWVIHLKQIVNQTQDNPFLQQAEISKAKADYMRKRYNKKIKTTEG